MLNKKQGINLIVLFFLLLVSATSIAIDCKKTRIFAEKAICNNQKLTIFDFELQDTFIIAKLLTLDNLAIIDSQKRWVDQRNKCTQKIDCIALSYKNRIDELNNYMRKQAQPCEVKEKQLIQAWESASSGYFEEFSLERDGEFGSWLHQHPAEMGTWSFDKRTCTISFFSSFSSSEGAQYIVLMPDHNNIILLDNDSAQWYQQIY